METNSTGNDIEPKIRLEPTRYEKKNEIGN